MVSCPATPQTFQLINARTLALMKPNAYLINIARGSVVNTEDLYKVSFIGLNHRHNYGR